MPSDLEVKVNLAREVVLALDRSLRIRRMYPSNHVRAVEATEDLVGKFLRFFDLQTYLRLSLSAQEISLEDRTLLRNPPHAGYIPFCLWHDGLREVRFHRGLTRDEVLEFLAIVGRDPREVQGEGEDFVSLLWAREFSAIDCVALDEFDPLWETAPADPEVARDVRDASEWIERRITRSTGRAGRDGLPAGEGEAGASGVGSRGVGLGASPAHVPSEVEDEDEPETLPRALGEALSTDLRALGAKFRAALETDTIGQALSRALEVLGQVPGGMGEEERRALVRGFAEAYVQRRDFCAIGHLLSEVAGPTGAGSPDSSVASAAEVLLGPRLTDDLVEFLNRRYSDDAEGLVRFLNSLGPRAGPLVCEAYPSVASARTRATLAQYLARRGIGSAEALRRLLQSGDRLLSEILDLFAIIKPADLVKDLEEYASHPSLAIRMQVIDVVASIEGYDRSRVLFRLLEDPDPRVRVYVLKTLATVRDPGTVLFLTDWIGQPHFEERDYAEKMGAFAALVATKGDAAVAYLVRFVAAPRGKRAIRRADATQQAAIAAIRAVESPQARAALDRIARHGVDPARTYARLALRR